MLNLQSQKIEENVELAPFTTWKIGGKARFFAYGNSKNILELGDFAKRMGVRMYVIGCGSNLLISSKGVEGLVVKMRQEVSPKIDIEKGTVSAEAGTLLSALIRSFSDNGFRGLEKLAGIPSSVGGAVYMNAGVLNPQKSQISDCFLSGEFFLKNGEIVRLKNSDLDFSYRHSALQENGAICLSSDFKLGAKEDSQVLKNEIRETLLLRKSRQPENRKNAGSVFKGLKDGTPAGKLIDECGLKGLRVGDAIVSLKHANWIENLGAATSQDVSNLIEEIKMQVAKKFDVELVEEIIKLGE